MNASKWRKHDTVPRARALAAAVLILLLGALSPVSGKEQAVVRLWNYSIHDKKYQQKMYKLFNERNPEIKIDYSSISNTVYAQVLEAAFIAKDPPDMFLPSDKLGYNQLTEKGWILPLNNVAPSEATLKEWLARFPPQLRKYVEGISMFNGKVYAVDLRGEGTLRGLFPMYYNKTLFTEAGVAKAPSTQSEFRQTAAKIAKAGQGKYFGLVLGLLYTGTWGASLEAGLSAAAGVRGVFGWSPDLKDGRFHQGSPEHVNALLVFKAMREDGSVYPGETNMEDQQAKMAFATNKAAIQFGGDWNIGDYLSYNPDCDFDLALAPTPDDGIRRGYFYANVTGGAFGYFVSSFTKNPAAVWKVIEFLSSLEYQEGWVNGGFGYSYLPEANRPENLKVPQMYKIVQWSTDPAWRRIDPVLSQEAGRVTQEYFPGYYPTHSDVQNSVYIGKTGVEALKDLENRMNARLDEAIAKAQADGLKVTRADFVFPDWDPSKDYVQKKK